METITLKSGFTAREGHGQAELDVEGHTFDLAALCDARPSLDTLPSMTAVAIHAAPRVGQVAWVWAMNRYRRGVITKVGRVNVTVAYVTETNLRESAESTAHSWAYTATIREKAGKLADVFVEIPPAPAAPAELESAAAQEEVTPEKLVELGFTTDEETAQLLAEAVPAPELPARERGAAGRLTQEHRVHVTRGAEAKLAAAILEDDQTARRVIFGEGGHRVTVRHPERRVVAGDTVRIHRGTRLYLVERVETEVARDNVGGGAERMVQCLVAPWDPADERSAQWVAEDLLHVVPPVARLKTLPVGGTGTETLAEEPVVVCGTGWLETWGAVRQVATIRGLAGRLPYAALLPWPEETRVEWAAGALRIGDSVEVDGRVFRVTWDGGPAEPVLVPENWHNFG